MKLVLKSPQMLFFFPHEFIHLLFEPMQAYSIHQILQQGVGCTT